VARPIAVVRVEKESSHQGRQPREPGTTGCTVFAAPAQLSPQPSGSCGKRSPLPPRGFMSRSERPKDVCPVVRLPRTKPHPSVAETVSIRSLHRAARGRCHRHVSTGLTPRPHAVNIGTGWWEPKRTSSPGW
jgi:hypothetical protein